MTSEAGATKKCQTRNSMFTPKKPHGQQEGDRRRAEVFVRRLWTAIETKEGRGLTNQELSAYLNMSETALSDWVTGKTELNQIEAVLRLCERLGFTGSVELLRQPLRSFPTLNSGELSHDPDTVDCIRKLLLKTVGITLIVGGNSSQRTFLIGAIGNSYRETNSKSRLLVGWDIHTPSWFVPLPGVLYLNGEHPQPGMLMKEAVRNYLIVSNGLWEKSGSHRAHIINLSRSNHVVVASSWSTSDFRRESLPAPLRSHVLEIGKDCEKLNVSVVDYSDACRQKQD